MNRFWLLEGKTIDIIAMQNKEAEAKEELKRRAKQLEMQRREQQRRAASSGGSSSFLGSGSGMGAYSPVPRFEAPSPTPSAQRTSSPAPSSLKPPAFKSSGMKLGSKKAKNADLLDAMGGEAVIMDDLPTPGASTPGTPVPMSSPESHAAAKSARGSMPTVTPEGYNMRHSIFRTTTD